VKIFSQRQVISNLLLITFLLSFFFWIFVTIKNSNKPQNTPNISSKELPKTPSQAQIISGTAKIIDGDTVIVNYKRIRLIGIDTPETKQKCLDKNNFEYFCGKMATKFLKKLINNRKIECSSMGKDIYRRYLGTCKLGQININHEMVKSGMAVIYNLREASVELKELERNARNKKLGIWQGAFSEPKQYRKKNRR
jgi:endonuclease YncB( thermonuclease family)